MLGTMKFTIKYDREWEEYIVRVWLNGKRNTNADYHTSDKDDAEGTMKAMKADAKKRGYQVL